LADHASLMFLREVQSVFRGDQVLATDHSGREPTSFDVMDDSSLGDPDESSEV
jgi:hypothetical protein